MGENVTEILQLNPGANGLTQLLVCAKSVGLAPVMAILLIAKFAEPLFVRFTFCAGLVVP